MAFVWSRLALAALLAAGAACAPAAACPDAAANDDGSSEPRLACCDSGQLVLLDVADDDVLGDALVPETPSVAFAPRLSVSVEAPAALHAPLITRNVLVVAPKTSPPQT